MKATKQRPVPVKIVDSGPATAPGMDKEYKPSMSFECSPEMPLPKLGATVTVTVTGKVISAERFQRRWDGGKKKARLEIEYAGPKAIRVNTGKATFDSLEADNPEIE